MTVPLRKFRIRFATEADVDAVIALRVHAETWLRCLGIEQWTVHATGEEAIRRSIGSGTTFVVTTGSGDIIGSLTLDEADPDFWSPAERSQAALYLYKFMIRSERRGIGLGDQLLDWASARAAECGAAWLRLDCWRTNTELHSYYEKRGFTHLDTRSADGRESGALFQRPAGSIQVTDPAVELYDDTVPTPLPTSQQWEHDRYDPSGEAALWSAASAEVAAMMEQPHPGQGEEIDHWRAALEAASRHLDNKAREIRQAQGMYYRVLSS